MKSAPLANEPKRFAPLKLASARYGYKKRCVGLICLHSFLAGNTGLRHRGKRHSTFPDGASHVNLQQERMNVFGDDSKGIAQQAGGMAHSGNRT